MFQQKLKTALSERKHLIILTDTNINTSPDADFSNRGYLKSLKDSLYEFLDENHLIIHNSEYTRYMINMQPSCIDHIMSNCPNFIFNVITQKTTIYDHCILGCVYK